MSRSFRQQVDESILDQAAALFASRGVAKTSVQEVADAVGLSKTGLLHHFPSKDALHEAVVAQAISLGDRVLDQVRDLPVGAGRDRSAIEVLVDVAFAHPGMVAMLLTPVMQGSPGATNPADGGIGGAAFEAFGLDPLTPVTERSVRVAGTLVVLAVLSLAAHRSGQVATWRPHIITTCFDALGHGRPGASRTDSHQVED